MKKITFIIVLLIIPFVGIAQGPWDFNGSADGWVKGSCAAATSPSAWVLTTNGSNNPNFSNTSATVDADANQFAAVTLRLSAGAPSLMRLRVPNGTEGFVFRTVVLDPSETDFVTYYIDASSSSWTGTVNDIRFQFKDDNGSTAGANHTTMDETIEIDRVEFINVIPREEKLVYEFNTDGDNEGFSTQVDATAVVAGGNLTITPDGGAIAKVTNEVNSIDATVNSHMHIVYQNLSADNNQLRVQFKSSVDSYASFVGVNTSVNSSMAAFETVSLDLATLKPTEWSGTAQDIQLAIRNTANNGNAASAGDFVIDSIVFNNSSTLNVGDLVISNFTIFPNPAKNVVNIKGINNISKIELFDITGKKVLESNQLVNDKLNIQGLNSGIYLLSLLDTDNNKIVKKLIIE